MSRSPLRPSRAIHLAAILSTLVVSAQAGTVETPGGSVTFAWGLDAEEIKTGTFQYVYPGDDALPLSTGGQRTATAGSVSASVNAWVDPYSGTFKAQTTATTGDAGRPTSIAQSYARLDLSDTVRISGPGATTTVTFRMSYDSQFSGLALSSFERVGLSHFLQADSSRYATLSYRTPNPAYDPEATCTGEGEMTECGVETIEYFTTYESASKGLFREWALGGPDGVYGNGEVNNGRYTGEVLLSLVVPTGVDLTLEYTVHQNARCFHLSNCDVGVNAMFSDHIGLELADGYTFTSASGFRYEGLAPAVPEPETLALMLAGLTGLGLARRRSQG
ncbi:PEP-CTERM sorting domain-containing protein [Aquabacterium parvum]|jgi:hypothetical protein|uniref:PEP-CTERM sorting domain-containing protein n=1 Tax=Aquabacterium parvum TaxID=70584 RepID=UPI000718B4E2|nr:PEP-CTERM sorting domain-containing protein [Aquabacterium parvum]MBU0916277.1 PEP-CTERM sorting domain-containing protein [Gammaproteobacteria bacterium]